ncbi:MAG: hypothetical protein HRT88_10620 [Lentisphaeraceae bacterium]|nr:hypothetical protein [Lentisphaeraceae bacterium]
MKKTHAKKYQSVCLLNGVVYLWFCGDFLLWRKRMLKVAEKMTGKHGIREAVEGEPVIDLLG